MALGLSRMSRVTSALATLDGTGATCMEVGMGGLKNRAFWWIEDEEQRTLTRILSRCVTQGDCVEWPGPFTGGYGVTTHLMSGKRKMGRTHRIVWQIVNGPIADGMVLDHTCRNRKCLNVEHLRVVTPYINSVENNDSPLAVHARKTHCPKCGGDYTTFSSKSRKTGMYRACVPCVKEQAKKKRQTPEARRRQAEREKARRDRLRANPEWVASQREYMRNYHASTKCSAHFTIDDVVSIERKGDG